MNDNGTFWFDEYDETLDRAEWKTAWNPTDDDDPRDWSDGDPDDLPIDDYEDDSWSDSDSFASAGWGEDEMYDHFDDTFSGGYDV